MSYDSKRKKAHCFSCGSDYDTFDLIGIDYGLSEHKEIFEKAYEYFNVSVENDYYYKTLELKENM
jgi:replicative DNA helicase